MPILHTVLLPFSFPLQSPLALKRGSWMIAPRAYQPFSCMQPSILGSVKLAPYLQLNRRFPTDGTNCVSPA